VTRSDRGALIGTAGWAIPRAVAEAFPTAGSGLVRYAARFGAAEINSSFHRSHRPSTYERWAASVPETFRFAAKLPKTITHERRLVDVEAQLGAFLDEVLGLGTRLGPLLIQLPPSLAFGPDTARRFLGLLRNRFGGSVACEPRHPTWFENEADGLLQDYEVARVAADPARVPDAAEPGGWPGLVYIRLHGSPRMYYSAYEAEYLDGLAARIARSTVETWCIFDNTTSGAACANALALLDRAGSSSAG
jgi:uncharacterized protein YecE (DUF72 family)